MRRIWSFTILIAVVAVTIVVFREYRKSEGTVDARRNDSVSRPMSENDYEALLARMFTLLEYDHQVWHGDTQQAVEAVAALADKGVRKTPFTYYALGLRLAGEQKTAEAEAAYRKAIELDAKWSWPYTALGALLYESGRRDDAIAAFARASELDPRSSRSHSDLSVLLRLDHRLDEAEKEAARAVELAPDRLDTLNTYANVLKEQGKLDKAEEYYRKAISADPKHPTPHYNLACLQSLRGRASEALTELARAFQLDPSYADFAQRDPDLKALHNNPKFKELVKQAGTSHAAAPPSA